MPFIASETPKYVSQLFSIRFSRGLSITCMGYVVGFAPCFVLMRLFFALCVPHLRPLCCTLSAERMGALCVSAARMRGGRAGLALSQVILCRDHWRCPSSYHVSNTGIFVPCCAKPCRPWFLATCRSVSCQGYENVQANRVQPCGPCGWKLGYAPCRTMSDAAVCVERCRTVSDAGCG